MMALKYFTGGVKEEYETQYYGFGCQTLQIAVRQMIQDNISSCIQDMGAQLKEALKPDEDGQKAITESCNELSKMYFERADTNIKAIDEVINNILNIPSNVVLAEDEAQLQQYTEEEHDSLKREVDDLQERLKRAALMELILKEECDEISEFEEVYKLANQTMETLDVLSKSVCDCSKQCACIAADCANLCSQVPVIFKNYDKNDDNNVI